MRKISLEPYKERIEEDYNHGFSLVKIAKEIGVSAGLIRKNMVLWGINRRATRKRELKKPSKEKLEQVYYDKNKSVEDILKQFGIGLTTLFRWLKEYNINPARRFKYKKTNFSENSSEKAYISGLVAGDIHARKHSRQILAELTTTHPAMIDLFFSVFGKYGTPKKYLKHNKITGRNEWKAYILLDSSFNFMLDDSVDIDNNDFYGFLAGFFDCEGCLYIYNNGGYSGITFLIYNSNKKLLKIIKRRLERDGFHPNLSKYFEKGAKTTDNYIRGADLWAIRMHTKEEVLSLMKIMPIKHKEKLNKLKIAMSTNNKWEEISDKINNLKMSIKKEVNEYIKPSTP